MGWFLFEDEEEEGSDELTASPVVQARIKTQVFSVKPKALSTAVPS